METMLLPPDTATEPQLKVFNPSCDSVFIDIDGVLADFVGAVCGVIPEIKQEEVTEWNFYKKYGLTDEQFWGEIEKYGPAFWANLDLLPLAADLIRFCYGHFSNVYLATSPCKSPTCEHGKKIWIQKYFGSAFRDYFITPRKWLLSAPGRILIDDSDDNVSKWNDGGGIGVSLPQPWNEAGKAGRNVNDVLSELAKYAS